MQSSHFFALFVVFVIAISAGPAWAGGLYLNEFATPAMGAAGAGAEALANDASTSFALHNPAGMTRLKESQLMLGGGLVFSTIQFDPAPNTPIPGNDGGDAGGPAPLLAAFYSHSLTDDLKLGFNVFSLSAAVRLEKRTKTAVAHVRKHADRITRELAGTARRPAKRRTKRRRKK